MGVRGGPHPHELVPIGCLLGDVLDAAGTDLSEFADLEPFEVLVLHPGRTLLEKLVHIHTVARALERDAAAAPDSRVGRHFYDVFQLLGDDRVLTLLADRDQTEAVMTSIEEIRRAHFGGSDETESRPEGGFAASPAFDLHADVSLRLRAGYETRCQSSTSAPTHCRSGKRSACELGSCARSSEMRTSPPLVSGAHSTAIRKVQASRQPEDNVIASMVRRLAVPRENRTTKMKYRVAFDPWAALFGGMAAKRSARSPPRARVTRHRRAA